MTTDEIVEIAIQGHASTRDAIRWAIQQEREACARVCDEWLNGKDYVHSIAKAIRARSDVHASDISQERVDETPECKDDPRAPHGFDRNASHSADRYVCECEGWKPPPEPPPECQTEAEKIAYAFGWWKAMEKKQWVGLAVNEAQEFYESDLSRADLINKIDEFLEEKNT